MLARLQNGSLDDALRRKHTSNSAGYRRSPVLLESKARVRIATEVAEALAHLHGLGLVHGRLQPSTILLGEGLTAKLGDTALRGPVKPRGQVRSAFNRCHALGNRSPYRMLFQQDQTRAVCSHTTISYVARTADARSSSHYMFVTRRTARVRHVLLLCRRARSGRTSRRRWR